MIESGVGDRGPSHANDDVLMRGATAPSGENTGGNRRSERVRAASRRRAAGTIHDACALSRTAIVVIALWLVVVAL